MHHNGGDAKMMSEECERMDHAFCSFTACDCFCHYPIQEKTVIVAVKGIEYAMPEAWAIPLSGIYGITPRNPAGTDLLPYSLDQDDGSSDILYFPYGSAPPNYIIRAGRLGGQEKPKPSLNGTTIRAYILQKMKGVEVPLHEVEKWLLELEKPSSEAKPILEALCKRGEVYEVSKDRFRSVS